MYALMYFIHSFFIHILSSNKCLIDAYQVQGLSIDIVLPHGAYPLMGKEMEERDFKQINTLIICSTVISVISKE